ncbi:hypothetical protein CQA44_11865, partial [Helicobacter sp. MIT 14-3879]
FHKQYSQSLSLILPCLSLFFYLMLIMGGISFKGIDPQYYEFKKLCNLYARKRLIGDKDPENFVYGDNAVYKKIGSRVTEMAFQQVDTQGKIIFYENNTYFYDNYGIFLKGDEGAGWYIDFGNKILDCSDLNKQFKRLL